MVKELRFYKQPFHQDKYSSWVYDADHNFVFELFPEFDEEGEYEREYLVLKKLVIDSLNSSELYPIPDFKLEYSEKDPNMIRLHGKPFILIRGWGNLTGTGAHNFSAEKASKIQDDFRDWIIYRLTGKSPIN